MKIMRNVFSWVKALVIAVLLSVVINTFIFQPAKVLGHSMEPTLHNKELIYISKIPHTFHIEPDYNDIVIIDSRVDQERTLADDLKNNSFFSLIKSRFTDEEPHNLWVKRVVGKPGDVLEFKNHKLYRNGKELKESYIKEPMKTAEDGRITVPSDSIFVMGDNRNHSMDSRYIGPVPLDHVLGRMVYNP